MPCTDYSPVRTGIAEIDRAVISRSNHQGEFAGNAIELSTVKVRPSEAERDTESGR